MSEPVRARVIVSGRVQGVFFRYEARQRAREAPVHGWVRNLDDGRVEAVFEGDREAVERMIGWCRRGPPMALVEEVFVDFEEPVGESGFSVR